MSTSTTGFQKQAYFEKKFEIVVSFFGRGRLSKTVVSLGSTEY